MKRASGSTSNPWFQTIVGMVLVVLAFLGVIHGVRAGVAQCLYREAKYGAQAADTDHVVDLCGRAYAWYPWNYYFSILAAEQAYYTADAVTGVARRNRLLQSQCWCDRGLIQNPWRSQLRRLHTRFLWEESPARAIHYWEAHTEWQFWEPYNHAVLAELYAKAGEFDKAEQALKWVQGAPDYEPTQKLVLAEKAAWNSALHGKLEGWGE